MAYPDMLRSSTTIRNEANQFIAGGVVSLNRKVDPHIVFKNIRPIIAPI